MKSLFGRTIARRPAAQALVLAIALAGVSAVAVRAHDVGGAPAQASESSPVDIASHIAQMSEHLYAEVHATAEQKKQLDPILSQASSDLAALQSQLGGGHERAMALLSQQTVDRTALESLRAEHMQIADAMSKRVTRLVADVADVLTPDQRKILIDHIAQLHAAGHGALAWHHG